MRTRSSKHALMLASSASLLSAASGAHAQSADPATIEEVIVTAQKRAERLIEAPQSVTALSSADLARTGAKEFVDFAATVPGLQFTTQGPGSSQLSLRGVTSGADVGPTVGVYVDEVPYGSSSAFTNGPRRALDVGLFDVERVEVLRGPQGTLYGASAMGGVLKYVMHAPVLDVFEGSAKAGVAGGSEGGVSYDGSLVVNAPLTEGVSAVRASAFYSRDGGFSDNVVTGQSDVDRGEVYGGRAELLFRPTDAFSARLTAFAQNVRRDGGRYATYSLAGEPVAGDLDQAHPLSEPFSSDFRLVSGTLDYDFGGAVLTSVTSYQTTKTKATTDGSAVYAPLLQLFFGIPATAMAVNEVSETKKFAQEVRLASTPGQSLEWLLGAFITREESQLNQVGDVFGAGLVRLPVNAVTAHIPSTYEEYALFGDLTWHITDRFDVTGGVRAARNEQKVTQQTSGLLVSQAPGSKSQEDVVTYLANARYRYSKDVTAYARFATGYRPGGPNYLVLDPATGLPGAPATFDSDSLNSYELGVKAETPDRRFGVDGAVYYIDWSDIQLLTGVAGVTTYVNGGGAEIKGAELAFTARPVRGLSASAAFAYNDGKLSDDAPALGAVKGERLPNVPRYTATLSADYTWLDAPLEPSVGASLRYVDDRKASFDASPAMPQYHLPEYTSLDLRAGLRFERFEAQAFVNNVFDEAGQLSAQTVLSSFGGPAQVTLLQPRTFGLRLTAPF
ncbi:TonB-dependent receptor [Phenylobacterium sp. LjRoot164]|uniref:TonB-dependent receptor n=1 Tax=unclassified Phenylobacterium TaxID=2640670 RepID=UPI003ECD4AF6